MRIVPFLLAFFLLAVSVYSQAQMLVTAAQAQAIFLRPIDLSVLQDLNNCLQQFSINTTPRIRQFLAQIGEESAGLKWLTELGTGQEYEGRRDLGNTQPGDGVKYKGAGAIQLTGRANYQAFANYMHDPNIMQGASYVASKYPITSAGFWWYNNNMNALVDSGASVQTVSARVNGRNPANGLAERIAYYNRAVTAIH
jgi:putative chitinase